VIPVGAGRRLAVAGLILALAVSGCGGSLEAPGPSAGAGGPGASEAPVSSPLDGVVIRLQSEGLTKVIGFRLRTDTGREVDFAMGKLENGVEFPPGHLAEHMAAATRIRVFFRDEAGARVVYRLEDAPGS
jgi:hypothetical protein